MFLASLKRTKSFTLRRCWGTGWQLTAEQVELAKKHATYKKGVPRVLPLSPDANARDGVVSFSAPKAAWFTTLLAGSAAGVYLTFDPALILSDLSFFFVSTGICVLFGHSLGMHRKFIHNSFECPKWFEYLLVHLGTLMGIEGPLGMMKAHDFRDWAQRQPEGECHDYYGQQQHIILDSHWQMCCAVELKNPPVFRSSAEQDPVYLWMQKYWMLQQVPWAILFYALGGWNWVVWGVFVRVLVGMYGHFLVGWFAHNEGRWSKLSWKVEGSAVQGQNVGSKILALISAGESYHNNHHAYPGSAQLAQLPGEFDLGWWTLKFLEKLGLVWDLKTRDDLPPRPELKESSALRAE
jgi:stearoyl-CoA desaturase (delta-9 desaturase)